MSKSTTRVRAHERKYPSKPKRTETFYKMAGRLAKECGFKFRVPAPSSRRVEG